MKHPEKPSLTKLSEDYEALKKKATAKIKDELHKYFMEWHKQLPALESISWTQYAPYFNDGDTCYFGVYAGDSVRVNGDSYLYDLRDEADKKELYEAAKTIGEYIESINGDFLLDAFGDHVEITITPTGILVDDHEHD